MTELSTSIHSQFFTNKNGNTLLKEFEGILTHNHAIDHLDAVSGFLRASGYFAIRPFLTNLKRVRVLIGIDIDRYIERAAYGGKLFCEPKEEVRADCLQLFRRDIDNSRYTREVEEGIYQMVDDIASGLLELRAHPSRRIHAKIYVLYPEDFNPYTTGVAISGSSNLTGNGLGVSDESQYEFNVKMDRYDDVLFAKNEFEMLWKEAADCPITATDIRTAIDHTYLKADVAPYDLYIKMLMEFFSDRVLSSNPTETLDTMPEGYAHYDYQQDAVSEGYQKLIRYNGFFLADVVGLGKTVIATMIAKKFIEQNGRNNTKVLVIYPPAVEQNWKSTFHDFGIDHSTCFLSNGSLSKVLSDNDNNQYPRADEYDLVIVDEAHKFRSSATTSFTQLQEICKMPRLQTGGIGGYRKKVMLISATPMNNTPADIYNEILLFQDPRRCTIDGVGNLTAFFAPLVREFRKLKQETTFNAAEFSKLSERVRDRIIRPLTVRRTRTDIEAIHRYRKDIGHFPKVERPIENRYKLNQRTAYLFEHTMDVLTSQLTYARYQAIAFLRPEASKGLYDNAEIISQSLAYIRKNSLVKRLESSFYAFKVSLKHFRQANQNLIDMHQTGKVFIASDLDVNQLLEAGMSLEEAEEKVAQKATKNPKNAVFASSDFQPDFIEKLRADQKAIEQLCEQWGRITDEDDSKFDKLSDLLRHEFFQTQRNPSGKLIIFSEAADTVLYLKKRINRPDVLAVTAKNRNHLFSTIRDNFDANARKHRNDFNIIITTDVLAEGINLHRANIIVNYDTPWNSTRLMQRIGRVNRIGSSAKHIFNYVFYPSREGNEILNLMQIALSKLQTFHSTFGEDNQVFSQAELIDRNVGHLFNYSMKQQNEERNLELPFFEELRTLFANDRREYNRIERLSLRSRTGRKERTVEGITLKGDSLVFLKTNFRKLFYLVSDNAVKELSVIDALSFFKAAKDEPAVERIEAHHTHVEKAVNRFCMMQRCELYNTENEHSTKATMGIQLKAALSLLDEFSKELTDPDLRLKVSQLRILAQQGVITYIAKRLQRIHRGLNSSGRARLTRKEALDEITALAHKYAPYFAVQEAQQNERETQPKIILSESFQ